jgi:hypothetical protein
VGRGVRSGTFFEGVMVKGFSSNATDAAVMANIVAAGYAKQRPISLKSDDGAVSAYEVTATRTAGPFFSDGSAASRQRRAAPRQGASADPEREVGARHRRVGLGEDEGRGVRGGLAKAGAGSVSAVLRRCGHRGGRGRGHGQG